MNFKEPEKLLEQPLRLSMSEVVRLHFLSRCARNSHEFRYVWLPLRRLTQRVWRLGTRIPVGLFAGESCFFAEQAAFGRFAEDGGRASFGVDHPGYPSEA